MTSRVVETLTEAFMSDPGFVWVLPDESQRRERLQQIFTGSVTHARRHGGVVAVDDGRATGVWLPDDRAVVGLVDAARGNMLLFPLRLGLRSMRRLNAAEHDGRDCVQRHVEAPYAYLMALAVHPDHQGRGLASEVMKQVEADARRAGHSTLALRTEEPRNVSLYTHLGFTLHGRHRAAASRLDVAVFSKPIDR